MPSDLSSRIAALSPRQRECLRLVAEGWEAKEIGRRLGISDMTVKNHLRAARAALGAARSIDAARLVAAADRESKEEREETGPPGASTPMGIADRSYLGDDRSRQSGPEAAAGLEDAGAWPPADADPLRLLDPTRRGRRNGLGLGARLAAMAMLTVLLIAAVGFFVEASRGLDF